jgi:hypothetical protein
MKSDKILAIIVLMVVHVSGKMIVQSPPELVSYFNNKYASGSLPYSIANYGIVPYGKVISGEIGVPEFL